MDLLRHGVDVKDVVLDKSKIDREKSRMKLESDEKHKEDQEKLVCIGVNGKIDKDTLMYRDVMDENGETKLKKGTLKEHHLTFTKEPGTECGTYLTHRVIPVKGVTAAVLSDEIHSVLKEFNSVHTLMKAFLIIQILVAKEALLRSLRIKLSGNYTPLVVHSIRMSFLSELFPNTLMEVWCNG